jgi:hypothetical protein
MIDCFYSCLEAEMRKPFLRGALLIAVVVSCAPANPLQPLSTAASALTPTLIPSLGRDEPSLIFFVSEQGKFEAWIPISESIIEYTVPLFFFGKSVECPILVSRLNGATATVQYCDLTSVDSSSQSVILEEVRDALEKRSRLKIREEVVGTVNGSYPALTLFGEQDMRGAGFDGTFKARILLVKNRIYIVQISVHNEDWCNCLQQMDQFVDDFYVDPEISIPFEPTP